MAIPYTARILLAAPSAALRGQPPPENYYPFIHLLRSCTAQERFSLPYGEMDLLCHFFVDQR
jgi:hypothetical protein